MEGHDKNIFLKFGPAPLLPCEYALSLLYTQTELNRRREQEIVKLKRDLETVISEREISDAALRKRHQDAVNELTQQLDNANRHRTKYDTSTPGGIDVKERSI